MELRKETISKIENREIFTLEELNNLADLIVTSKNHHKTFQENQKIWGLFYQNRECIFRKYLLEESLFIIIKFLIQEENGQIFQYFISNLVDSLSRSQQELCFRLRNKTPSSKEDINSLIINLDHYEQVVELLESLDFDDNITKNSIQNYQNQQLQMNTTEALIIILHKLFFELSPKVVKSLTDYISKSPSFILQNNNLNTNWKKQEHLNMIFQYLTKILPIKEFMGENLKQDKVIQALLFGKLTSSKIINTFFKTLSEESIIQIFDGNIYNFLIFLNQQEELNIQEKQEQLNFFMDSLLSPTNFQYLLPLIIDDCQDPFWRNFLTKTNYEKIINYALGIAPSELDYKTIKYFLDHDYLNELSISNLYQAVFHDKNFLNEQERATIKKSLDQKLEQYHLGVFKELESLEIKTEDSIHIKIQKAQKYNLIGKTINFSLAIDILTRYLENHIQLGPQSIQAIIRSIIQNMLDSLHIEHNGTYFVKHQRYNGAFDELQKTIDINVDLITNLLKKTTPFYKRLHVFVTSFHEMKHAQKKDELTLSIYDYETYEMKKEEELMSYDQNYYQRNYKYTKQEIDARIAGYDMLAKFIETFLPQYLDAIQDAISKSLELELQIKEKQEQCQNIEILGNSQINFQQAFDTLVIYHPNIIHKNPIFLLEYHENGIPKTSQEIKNQRTKDNSEIIDGILKNRYPKEFIINTLEKSFEREESNQNSSRKVK